MKVKCLACGQEYDDTFRNTQCPHESFEMHCGVFVNGQQGCAHTIEELTKATKENILPNPDCEYQTAFNLLSESIRRGMTIDRVIAEANAEILANGGLLHDESCHFGDCEREEQ